MNAEIVASYGTGQAAAASNIEHATADRWLSRGMFRLGIHDIEANGHGNHRRWSLRTVRKLALMASLHRAGANPARASAWAASCIDRCSSLPIDVRSYAAFQHGGGVKILSIEGANRFEDALDDLIEGSDSVVIVDISRLFSRVDERLASVSGFIG